MSVLLQFKMQKKYVNMSLEERWCAIEVDVDALLKKSRNQGAIPMMLRDDAFKLLATAGLRIARSTHS